MTGFSVPKALIPPKRTPPSLFLRSRNGSAHPRMFWVSGKPGSRKSTLMKCLTTNEETRRLLQEWAQDGQLVIATFFLWNAAKTSLQKTQQDLLRSLLYQILRQSPEAIKQVYPEVSRRESVSRSRDDNFQPSNFSITMPGLFSAMRISFFELRAKREISHTQIRRRQLG